MIAGIIYSCQFLIITADQPSLAENIMTASGYTESELLAEQKITDYETTKINKVIRNAFRRQNTNR